MWSENRKFKKRCKMVFLYLAMGFSPFLLPFCFECSVDFRGGVRGSSDARCESVEGF